MVSRPTKKFRQPLKITLVDLREQLCSQQQQVSQQLLQPQMLTLGSQHGIYLCTFIRKHGAVSASSDTTCKTSVVPQMFCPIRVMKVSQTDYVDLTTLNTQ